MLVENDPDILFQCDECGSSISPNSPLMIVEDKHYCTTDCFFVAQLNKRRTPQCTNCKEFFWSGMKGITTEDGWFHSEKCSQAYQIAREVHNAHPSTFIKGD